ncbi:MAG TPA: zinc ABC transporter substrate-binding protein, partial [bacterium]|nr:zinc ABC transporter substrate-binding protein [bacterium]
MRIRTLLCRCLLGGLLGALLLLGQARSAQATVRVFACEPDWAALAQEIGGDEVSIYSATTAFQDPHQIQARPSLIARLRNADLLFCSGAELEIGWLPVLMVQAANGGIQPGAPGYLMAADYVHLLEVPVAADRALGDVHPMGNPHIQTGAQNYIPVAQHLAERLSILDPAHTAEYQARLKSFTERWEAAMKKWEQEAAPLKGVPVLAHHQGWS